MKHFHYTKVPQLLAQQTLLFLKIQSMAYSDRAWTGLGTILQQIIHTEWEWEQDSLR